MRITTARQFRANAAGLLRSEDLVLVTQYGRLVGVFFSRPAESLPSELRREVFSALSSEVAREIKKRRVSEKDILRDLKSWRKNRRKARS
jgi:hypothetical protein